MSDFLDQLAAAPLANPLKPFRPEKPLRRKASQMELEARRENRQAKAARLEREREGNMAALLDYYATTKVPAERIAAHIGLGVEAVRAALAERGRTVS